MNKNGCEGDCIICSLFVLTSDGENGYCNAKMEDYRDVCEDEIDEDCSICAQGYFSNGDGWRCDLDI